MCLCQRFTNRATFIWSIIFPKRLDMFIHSNLSGGKIWRYSQIKRNILFGKWHNMQVPARNNLPTSIFQNRFKALKSVSIILGYKEQILSMSYLLNVPISHSKKMYLTRLFLLDTLKVGYNHYHKQK